MIARAISPATRCAQSRLPAKRPCKARYAELVGGRFRDGFTQGLAKVLWAEITRALNGDAAGRLARNDITPDQARVFFGATVTIADEDDARRSVTIVGDDEQDASGDRIGWSSPLARALRTAAVGDLRSVRLPGGEKEWEVLAITYPASASG